MRFVDKDGKGFDSADLPTNCDHLVRDIRLRTTLLAVYEQDVTGNFFVTTTSASFAANAVLQRTLEPPGALEHILSSPAGLYSPMKRGNATGYPTSTTVHADSDKIKRRAPTFFRLLTLLP